MQMFRYDYVYMYYKFPVLNIYGDQLKFKTDLIEHFLVPRILHLMFVLF